MLESLFTKAAGLIKKRIQRRCFPVEIAKFLTLFRWGQKSPATSFSPVTSTNVGISLQNLLTFSFNPFAALV